MVRQFKEAGADKHPAVLTASQRIASMHSAHELHCKAAYGIHLQQQVDAGEPGTAEALLQSLAAGTQRDEDTHLVKNGQGILTACCQPFSMQQAHLQSSLGLCSAGS